jgi:hypothetical protein
MLFYVLGDRAWWAVKGYHSPFVVSGAGVMVMWNTQYQAYVQDNTVLNVWYFSW